MEGSNLRFLIQSQASYHWTNPQSLAQGVRLCPGAAGPARETGRLSFNMVIATGRFVKTGAARS